MQLHDATRFIAVGGGLIGLALFYQPWVGGKIPGVGDVALTGEALAQGRARDLADAASIPPPRGQSAGGAAVAPAPAGGLTLPTRVPTFAPGSQGQGGLSVPSQPTTVPAAAGGMTLPTRVPTFAPGAQAPGSLSMPAQLTPTPAGAGAGTGGITLPTRVPTFAPGALAPTTLPSAAERAAISGTPQPTPTAEPARIEPAQLPKLTLYVVPLAGAGLAIFSVIIPRLRDSRDRLFGKWWTVILGIVGAVATGSVVTTVGQAAGSSNNLLAPGQATDVLWGAWASLLAFAGSTVSIAWTWLAGLWRQK